MTWLFSKRCQNALREGKIKVSIPSQTRIRLWKTLEDYNETWTETSSTNFNYDTSTLDQLPGIIEAELGLKQLLSFTKDGNDRIAGDLETFMLRGIYPPNLLDILELFYLNSIPEKANEFQRTVNEIMEEGGLSWRMSNGKIFPLDSAYMNEILGRASDLIASSGFEGCLREFEKARTALINGDNEGAVQNANLAVESACKEITGIKRAKPGELYRALIDSGIIPEYYNGFLNAFEENVLRAPAIMRNAELGVGHGRGQSTSIVPPELAELAINLSAVIIYYLCKKSSEKKKTTEDN